MRFSPCPSGSISELPAYVISHTHACRSRCADSYWCLSALSHRRVRRNQHGSHTYLYPRSCVTHSVCWGVFADVASHPPPSPCPELTVCLLCRVGSLCTSMCRSAQTCCHFPLATGTVVVSQAVIVWLSFSHILFLPCLKCGMTSSSRHSIVQSNRMPVRGIRVMSPLFMFVYVPVSPINEKLLHSLACE